jgi:ribonucleoside-diphosphate reductase alpha chain
LSAPDAIGQAIDRYLEEIAGVQQEIPLELPARTASGAQAQAQSVRYTRQEEFIGSCPECGTGSLAYEEGCVKCHVCGYSECG